MCKTPVIYMFHTCNTDVYPTHVIHVSHYMYNTGVYPMYYKCKTTWIIQGDIRHMYRTCVEHVYYTCICYTCNTTVFLHI